MKDAKKEEKKKLLEELKMEKQLINANKNNPNGSSNSNATNLSHLKRGSILVNNINGLSIHQQDKPTRMPKKSMMFQGADLLPMQGLVGHEERMQAFVSPTKKKKGTHNNIKDIGSLTSNLGQVGIAEDISPFSVGKAKK